MNSSEEENRVKVIGVTGGTGVGKSMVSRYMREKGFEVLDADEIGKMLVEPGMPALDEYVEAFGRDILNEDGSLNRKKLGGIVFSDSRKLDTLNDIIQKRIREHLIEQAGILKSTCENDIRGIVIDAALLFEHNCDDLCDVIWVVDADEDVRIKRIMNRDGISVEVAKGRIGSQIDNEKKKEMADAVIDNSSDVQHLYEQVDRELAELKDEKN